MKKVYFFFVFIIIISCIYEKESSDKPWEINGKLEISENGRYIQHEDGTPFFWFGDTDWVLFHRTSLDDADIYFKDRAEKGFNVIQASITAAGVIEGATDSSSNMVNGQLPFLFTDTLPDPTKPNPKFFAYVDEMIDKAAEYNLYIALLPTWAEFVCPGWHNGPKFFNAENARQYGEWLGERYRDKPNIIWVNGGDRKPDFCDSADIKIYQALGEGIKSIDPNHLMTYHISGNSSSHEYFHNENWLDFNMYQSIRWPQNIVKITTKAYTTNPPKPVVNGEPFYFENRQIQKKFDNRVFRSQPYWSLIAGARGYTFGQHHVWFFDKDDQYKNFENNTSVYWYEKLNTVGTQWTIRCINIFKSLEWWKLIPDSSIIVENKGKGLKEITACRMEDNSKILVYFPLDTIAKLDLSILKKDGECKLIWYKTDEEKEINSIINIEQNILQPPKGWEDALLLIE